MRHTSLGVIVAAAACGLSLAMAGCGSGISGPSGTVLPGGSGAGAGGGTGTGGGGAFGTSGSGRVSIQMTDSPYGDASAVLVEISDVSVHSSGGGWESVPMETEGTITCDLKQLEGPIDIVGDGVFDAGHYTGIRLTVASGAIFFGEPSEGGEACAPTADVVEPDDPKGTVVVPSGVIHLNRPFTVPDGGVVTILLDFDGDASIREINENAACNGNKKACDEDSVGTYRLSPVIAVISVEEEGGEEVVQDGPAEDEPVEE
jgi:hypothetical protein